MICESPPVNLIENLLLDAGVSCANLSTVLSHLISIVYVYETEKSTDSLRKIADDLYACIEPKLNTDTTNLSENIGKALIFIIILTAIFIFLIICIVVILRESSSILIILTFFLLLLYVLFSFLIIHNASLNISNNTNDITNDIKQCVKNSIIRLDTYETTQQNAFNNALCAYPQNNKCNTLLYRPLSHNNYF